MSRTSNPITTAVRSWVLRSPGRLALGVLIAVVSLFALRGVIVAATGGTTGSDTAVGADVSASTTTASAHSALEEVTESQVLALAGVSVADSPARAAMFYAHTFLDTTASPTQWTLRLATVTDPANVTDRIAAARPAAPVAILGPTRTTTAVGYAGTRVAIDTSAGTLTATLTQHDADEKGWQLASPLPTLDLTALPTTTTTTMGAPAATTTTSVAPSTTAPTPPPSTPTVQAPAPTDIPIPVPVPGPIPIPDLDTPLPGARQ